MALLGSRCAPQDMCGIRLNPTAAAAGPFAATTTAPATTCLRFVHPDSPPLQILAIELLNGGVGGFIRRHFDKAETPRAVGFAVHDHLGSLDLARFREEVTQILIGNGPRQVPHIQSATHSDPLTI